jgi:hypothetical protein
MFLVFFGDYTRHWIRLDSARVRPLKREGVAGVLLLDGGGAGPTEAPRLAAVREAESWLR